MGYNCFRVAVKKKIIKNKIKKVKENKTKLVDNIFLMKRCVSTLRLQPYRDP